MIPTPADLSAYRIRRWRHRPEIDGEHGGVFWVEAPSGKRALMTWRDDAKHGGEAGWERQLRYLISKL